MIKLIKKYKLYKPGMVLNFGPTINEKLIKEGIAEKSKVNEKKELEKIQSLIKDK